MSIRLKIMLPILLALLGYAAAMHFIWQPILLQHERDNIATREKDVIRNIAPTFLRDLLWSDLGAIHATLDRMREINNEENFQIELYNPDGKRLYPLTAYLEQSSPNSIELDQDLVLNDKLLGRLHLKIDWTESRQQIEAYIANIELAIIGVMLFIFLVMLALLEWGFNRPLIKLKQASSQLADGDFDVHIPQGARDEVGALASAFNDMRLALKQQQSALEHKATEASELATRYQSLIEFMPGALISLDVNGVIQDFNPSAEDIFQYPAKQIIGENFSVLLADQQYSNYLQELFEQALLTAQEGTDQHADYEGRRRNGSHFPMSIWVNSMQLAKRSCIILIAFDITEARETEQQLLAAIATAEKASQAKSDFLSSMSHELRTPMNAILGFAQLLNFDESFDAEQRDNLHEILKAGNHLLKLINEVLDLAKVESGHLELSLESVNVVPLLDETLSLISALAEKRNISLQRPEMADYCVRADHSRLKQALLNLLSNAIKYNKEGGSVLLKLEPRNDTHLRILVSDTGPGIATDRLHEVFMPFNRITAENSGIEGTGIGLTLTRSIVEIMGGSVGVDSEPGKGSTFWIELAIDTQPKVHKTTASHRPKIPSSGSAGNKHTVLYIEDNPANLRLVEQILTKHSDVHLLTARTAEMGLELASAHQPQLILLDINLPGIDGYQALQKLQLDERLRAIPVIAITANAMPNEIERGMAAGFNDYLTKPLDVTTFLKKLHHFLAAAKPVDD